MCDRQQSSLSCADSLAGEDPDLSSQEEEEEGVFVYVITTSTTCVPALSRLLCRLLRERRRHSGSGRRRRGRGDRRLVSRRPGALQLHLSLRGGGMELSRHAGQGHVTRDKGRLLPSPQLCHHMLQRQIKTSRSNNTTVQSVRKIRPKYYHR